MKVMLYIVGAILAGVAAYMTTQYPSMDEWLKNGLLLKGNVFSRQEITEAWNIIYISGGAGLALLAGGLYIDMQENLKNEREKRRSADNA